MIVMSIAAVLFISGCTSITGQATRSPLDDCKTVETPYTIESEKHVMKEYSATLFYDEISSVPGRQYHGYYYTIDIDAKENNKVLLTFRELTGSDINFFVFDKKNFESWKNRTSYTAYVSVQHEQSATYSFVPDHSDVYYFVFDNAYSQQNKTARLSGSWSYIHEAVETVNETVYKNVTKCK